MKYRIAVSWTMVHEVEIYANSLEEAIKIVNEDDGTIINTDKDGCYLDDSFEVNEEVTKELNNEYSNTECDSGCPVRNS